MPESKYPNPWHPDDPVKFSVAKRAWILDFPWSDVSKDMMNDLEKGRLTMRCPNCQAVNIAGPWCPKCGRMVRPENWINVQKASASKKRGRRSKEDLSKLFDEKDGLDANTTGMVRRGSKNAAKGEKPKQ